jgi:glutamine amidotransferase-like uncharacterized protein
MAKKSSILVYTEHPMCSIDCADAVCDLLKSTGKYNVHMYGRDSFPKIDGKYLFFKADCIVFPGGDGDSDQFDEFLYTYKSQVRKYVKEGGRYLGICMGSYFAGSHYFNLLDTNIGYTQYVKRPNSTVNKTSPSIVKLNWKGEEKEMYFHDGAAFYFKKEPVESVKIYGTYKNGDIAAMIQSYGEGKIGVIGPHPEAQKWWFYSQSRIKDGWHHCIQHDLFLEFFDDLIK